MSQLSKNMNKSGMSFNTRFAIAVLFLLLVCILIGYIMRVLFDADTFVPVMTAPMVLLFANYKKMKANYEAKNKL